jgi:hypothetical protein
MTEQKFRTQRKVKIAVSALIVVAGAAMGVYSLLSEPFVQDFSAGFQHGTSLGLIGAGIVTFIQTIIILKNPEKLKKEYIKRTDERAVAVSKSAFQLTYWITFIGLVIGGFVGSFYSETIVKTCCMAICGMLVVYSVCFFIVDKKS